MSGMVTDDRCYIEACDVCHQPIYCGEDRLDERRHRSGEISAKHSTLEFCVMALASVVQRLSEGDKS